VSSIDTHYVAEEQWLIPAEETAYASDPVFGYRASNLREWVEEKTKGRISHQSVSSISVGEIRIGGPARVTEWLKGLSSTCICVVNAASSRDLEVCTDDLLKAEDSGKHFLYRTAASFARIRAGLSSKPLLTSADLGIKGTGGEFMIAGSHVPKTTQQLKILVDFLIRYS